MPNERELLAIAGEPSTGRALGRFAEVSTVVVKRGADGALGRGGGKTASCVPPPVEPVDTTGAGDSFDAGFLFGMLGGYDLERSEEHTSELQLRQYLVCRLLLEKKKNRTIC